MPANLVFRRKIWGARDNGIPPRSTPVKAGLSREIVMQAAKCKWRALRHTCLLLLSVLGGMPASHQGMQARLFFVVDI